MAFTECIGPFVVPGAGHFLQWKQAGILNRALAHFMADLLEGAEPIRERPGKHKTMLAAQPRLPRTTAGPIRTSPTR